MFKNWLGVSCEFTLVLRLRFKNFSLICSLPLFLWSVFLITFSSLYVNFSSSSTSQFLKKNLVSYVVKSSLEYISTWLSHYFKAFNFYFSFSSSSASIFIYSFSFSIVSFLSFCCFFLSISSMYFWFLFCSKLVQTIVYLKLIIGFENFIGTLQ